MELASSSPAPVKNHKRNRRQSDSPSKEEDGAGGGEGRAAGGGGKKPREEVEPDGDKEAEGSVAVPKPEEYDDDDDDDDYDDLMDDFATPTDMDDYLDDEDVVDDCEDDISTTSTRTTMSTGSVGSNTPSLVGENLESFCLGESGEGKAKKEQQQQTLVVGGPVVRNTEPPLRRSLFSHVPPSINFVHHNEVPETPLPAELRKNLRWKLSNITPAVVKKVVTNSGFRLMRKNCAEWGGTWGKHMKSSAFKESVGEAQKINHFPGTFNIGRKDRLWKNYHKLRVKFGKEEFGFLPRTFCLPGDTKLLKKVWEKRGVKAKWIIKPPAVRQSSNAYPCY